MDSTKRRPAIMSWHQWCLAQLGCYFCHQARTSRIEQTFLATFLTAKQMQNRSRGSPFRSLMIAARGTLTSPQYPKPGIGLLLYAISKDRRLEPPATTEYIASPGKSLTAWNWAGWWWFSNVRSDRPLNAGSGPSEWESWTHAVFSFDWLAMLPL